MVHHPRPRGPLRERLAGERGGRAEGLSEGVEQGVPLRVYPPRRGDVHLRAPYDDRVTGTETTIGPISTLPMNNYLVVRPPSRHGQFHSNEILIRRTVGRKVD